VINVTVRFWISHGNVKILYTIRGFVIIEHFIELTTLVQGIQSPCKQKFRSQGRLALLLVKAIEMA
jgi:hypothetical protein